MPGYLQAFMKAGVLCVCCSSPVGRVASCADPRHPLPRRRKHDNVQGIVHPLVSAARDEWVAARHAEGVRLAVLDVPLLFETGGDADVDCVVVVSAPAERQRERVLARPGMTEGKFEAILARQLPDEQKRQRADVVIDTGCAVEVTRAAVAAMVEQQRGMTHRGEAEP